MAKQQVHLEHRFQSPVNQVFEFFADHEKFGRIWPGKTQRITAGETEANGLSSVREIRVGPVCFEETVVAFERPRLIEYTITRGSPLKNHYGRIAFLTDGEGCRVDYHIEFQGRFPLIASLVARNLKKDFKAGLAALQAELP
ncbi:MAG: SRPBCC family protein [Oceanococcus sp.]